MDTRRLLMAALLSLGVLMAWQAIFPPSPPVEQAPSIAVGDGQQAETDPLGVAAQGTSEGALDAAEPETEQMVTAERVDGPLGVSSTLQTENWSATIDSTGGRVVSMRLLQRRTQNGEAVELVRRRAADQPSPFSFVDQIGHPLPLDSVGFAVTEATDSRVSLAYSGPEGQVTKTFSISDAGLLDYDIRVERGPSPWFLWLGPGVANPEWSELDDRFSKSARQASVMSDELESKQTSKLEQSERLTGDKVRWFSLEDKYFLVAVAPDQRLAEVDLLPVRSLGDEEGGVTGFTLVDDQIEADGPLDSAIVFRPTGPVASGSSYWGAKEYTRLKALPFDFEKTVRFGMFSFLARPLLYGLRWIHSNVTPNWGWSIVLMTLAINLVLFPLRHKSFVSMQKMQKLNPRMEAIRGKFRPKLRDKQGRPNLDNQRKMNEEIQALFKEEGVNPAMGCLPLLLQMPVFFAFYRLLGQAVELQGAPWIGWIADLSVQDPYKALPLLMGATQFLQTKTMPPVANPTQRILMNTMPIWFTFFAFTFPAGLVLYWLTNNVLTIFQQAGYNRLKKAGYFGGEPETKVAAKSSRAKTGG